MANSSRTYPSPRRAEFDPAAIGETALYTAGRGDLEMFTDAEYLEMFGYMDKMLGYTARPLPDSPVSYDFVRTAYLNAIWDLSRATGLDRDTRWLLRYMALEGNAKFDSLEHFSMGAVRWARMCPFEPLWHMSRRNDTKRLPNKSKYNNPWKYLRRLYTDPHESIRRIPNWVRQCYGTYPGYKAMVEKAISDGHEWLKQAYGPDVDLTPREDPVIAQAREHAVFTRGNLMDGSLLDSIRGA